MRKMVSQAFVTDGKFFIFDFGNVSYDAYKHVRDHKHTLSVTFSNMGTIKCVIYFLLPSLYKLHNMLTKW